MLDLKQILENRSWCKNVSYQRQIIAILIELRARNNRSDLEVQDTFAQIVAGLYSEENWIALEKQLEDIQKQ